MRRCPPKILTDSQTTEEEQVQSTEVSKSFFQMARNPRTNAMSWRPALRTELKREWPCSVVSNSASRPQTANKRNMRKVFKVYGLT